MQKVIRITINVVIFALIIGFAVYIINMLYTGDAFSGHNLTNGQPEGLSPYKKSSSFKTKSEIIRFDLLDDKIYIAVNHAVMIYDKAGTLIKQFPVSHEIRDIKVETGRIYLLYPEGIAVFTAGGEQITGWKAYRINSDYCSFVLSSEFIFVTDAGNKHICKYTKEGEFMSIILSPDGFIIPSYAFDIINIRDTLYCSNSGRHRIESYTLAGEYIASFGKSGNEAGQFAGCCNPVNMTATQRGDILTSEKGNPRISCFSCDGTFKAMLLGSKMLGGGTKAYRIKVQEDKLYVAGKNVLSEYVYDPQMAAQSSCAGCPSASHCP